MTDEKSEETLEKGHAGKSAEAEPVMETVAKTIGTAMGVIAATAAKALGSAPEKPPAKAGKTRSAHKSEAATSAGGKLADARMALKKKKRKAHKVKLRKSHAKG